MKIMFLDESGDHSLKKVDKQYPVFCLTGVIIDEKEYIERIIPEVNRIKNKYWKKTDIVFHSHDIRKCVYPFNNLLSESTRKKFYKDLDFFLLKCKIEIIATVILKEKLKFLYSSPDNPYNISMMFLMERFLYYLEEINDQGYISVEARDSKSNKDLFEEYSKILANGSGSTYFIEAKRFQSCIKKIEFITKKQNEIGHQLADLIAYPTSNKILYPTRKNPSFDVIKSKFRQKNGKIKGFGIKIFP